MTPELIKAADEANRWMAVLPEILFGCLAVLLLVLEMALPKRMHGSIPRVSILGQLAVLVWLLVDRRGLALAGVETFGGLLKHSAGGDALRIFFVIASILVSALGTVALAKQKLPRIEFFHIVLVVSAAMMLLAQSNHFVMLFVALETITVGFYILVSYYRTSSLSLEAGLKYLIMGALSSGILLFGIVLLYGVAGNPKLAAHAADSLHFGQLQAFLAANPGNLLASVGVCFVLAGIAFKIGLVPFQIWIPDVYQGAPTPVTAFLAVSSKAAGVAILLVLVQTPFAPYRQLLLSVLSVMAASTLIFGNLSALTQYNVKRLIGLSGVSHAGYLLVGIIAVLLAPTELDAVKAVGGIYFYLFAYLFASFAVFGVMNQLATVDDANQELEGYADLAKEQPFLAAVLAVGLGSLAGIPPLAGFLGKLMIFIAAYQAGLYWLLAVAIGAVVVSIYYYFAWIKAAFFAPWRPPLPPGEPQPAPANRAPIAPAIGATLAVLALASIILGFYQAPLTGLLGLR